ncbi:MAG: DUF29 domain-containing protein [Chloroflexaceae bacterium]|nr:DUF29 domain-containing protein [Chloroflexaceae bacterium]
MDWHEVATRSHYQTAAAVQACLHEGDIEAVGRGIEELVAALGRSERRALKSQLVRLVTHVIKWKEQPERRTSSWVYTIESARMEIADLLEEEPSLRPQLPDLLSRVQQQGQRLAEAEMQQPAKMGEVSWQELFEDRYFLGNDGEVGH